MKAFSGKKKKVAPVKEDLKETLEASMEELLDGRILADKVIRRNIVFIHFHTFLGLLYIANG